MQHKGWKRILILELSLKYKYKDFALSGSKNQPPKAAFRHSNTQAFVRSKIKQTTLNRPPPLRNVRLRQTCNITFTARGCFRCKSQQESTIKQSGPRFRTACASSQSCGGNPRSSSRPHDFTPHTPDGGFKRIRHTEQNENTPTASPVGQGLRTYPTGNALKGVKSGFTGRWLTT